MPGFLSSNLYYKYLNDLIHSVRGDEFLGGNVSLAGPNPSGPPDESHPGGPDSSASQVLIDMQLLLAGKGTANENPSLQTSITDAKS